MTTIAKGLHADNGDFTPSSGNVFADLGLPDPDLLLAKAEFAIALTSIIRERGLTQTAAVRELGVHQSRISAIMRGRLDDFSLERLITFARRLGQAVNVHPQEIEVQPTGCRGQGQ